MYVKNSAPSPINFVNIDLPLKRSLGDQHLLNEEEGEGKVYFDDPICGTFRGDGGNTHARILRLSPLVLSKVLKSLLYKPNMSLFPLGWLLFLLVVIDHKLISILSFLRYRNSLVFVVRPFPECVQTDGIRLVPKMDELLTYTDKMEAVLQENAIPYTVIDVLNLKERVDIVRRKILEHKGLKVSTRVDKDVIIIRDD